MELVRRYPRFASYQEFAAFDTELTQQLATRQVVVVPLVESPTATPFLAEAYYQMAGSGQVWVLSSPDNAWRGYFLPLEEALAYHRPPRSRWLGCLLPLALAGLYAVWRLISR